MKAFHNSYLEQYRSPFGAAPTGAQVRLCLDITDPVRGMNCFVRTWQDGKGAGRVLMACEGWGATARFSALLTMPEEPGLLWYSFVLETMDSRAFYGAGSDGRGGPGRDYESSPKSWQITVYRPSATPAWYRNGIAYQIFPDRFFRGSDWLQRQAAAVRPDTWRGPKHLLQLDWNDTPHYYRAADNSIDRWTSFGGTLTGIREKLPYLKSLGVTVLYLNPIFEAASNHGYDTADYMRVDPALGDAESFRMLAEEAHKLDIRIILDGVFSHTGADSIYFNARGNYGPGGAAQDRNSPYASWYRFKNWPKDYECWWGVTDLPNVNEMEPSYLEFICGENGVIRTWLRLGADGWRLDVADELPDAFIAAIRSAMAAEKPDSVLLGEVWEDASNKISYGERRRYLLGDELQSTMHYPFREAALGFMQGKLSPEQFRLQLLQIQENYPPEAFYSCLNLIGSHDRARILTLLGDPPDYEKMTEAEREKYRLPDDKLRLAKNRLKLLSLIQFTMPGLPCIYYGDEAGVQGFTDPFNRSTYPWGREDPELLQHYRTITALRSRCPALAGGSYVPQAFGSHVYGCLRSDGQQTLQVLANRGVFETETITVPVDAPYVLELLTAKWMQPENGKLTVTLPPLSGMVLLLCESRPQSAPRTRCSGVVCHITAVPAAGETATLTDGKAFVDFLEQAGQRLWQVLPLNPPDRSGSPYCSPGAFAGNTALIDRTLPPDPAGYADFCAENAWWLDDYALFTALKAAYGGAPWTDWPEEVRDRRDLPALLALHAEAAEAERREQYWFWSQWQDLKDYAALHGVTLIGDMPLSVSADSADVWAAPQLFCLDAEGRPAMTAGCPPDYFNKEGQNWSTPVYNWDALAADGYSWWIGRLRHALQAFDFVRLDHFRGFSAYYCIPAGGTAADGAWRQGPGLALFRAAEEALGGPLPILAEDLGTLDAGVYDLLELTGFPGMDVCQFELGKMQRENGSGSRIYYASTHDSQTLAGWCAQTYPAENPAEKAEALCAWLQASEADWVLLQLQDLLGLGDEARYNTPGTVGPHNWSWRAAPEQLTAAVAEKAASLARQTGRI